MISKTLLVIALVVMAILWVASIRQNGETKFQAIALTAMLFLATVAAHYIGW